MGKIATKSDSFTYQIKSFLNENNFTSSHKTIEEHCTAASLKLIKFYVST